MRHLLMKYLIIILKVVNIFQLFVFIMMLSKQNFKGDDESHLHLIDKFYDDIVSSLILLLRIMFLVIMPLLLTFLLNTRLFQVGITQ